VEITKSDWFVKHLKIQKRNGIKNAKKITDLKNIKIPYFPLYKTILKLEKN